MRNVLIDEFGKELNVYVAMETSKISNRVKFQYIQGRFDRKLKFNITQNKCNQADFILTCVFVYIELRSRCMLSSKKKYNQNA